MADLQQIWNETLSLVERDLPRPTVETWLRNTRPVASYEDVVVVAVPNQFARAYIAGRYSERLAQTLSQVLGRSVEIRFVLTGRSEEEEPRAEQLDLPLAAAMEPARAERGETEPLPADRPARGGVYSDTSLQQPLNPKYTFESFVIGSGNRLAHAASLAVAEAPAQAYNPLFLYGGVGLGKTHLMQAIAHHILKRQANARVAYVSSETFANEMINSIRDRKTVEFRNRYRNVDILLVDDIQFLAGKESTQEEFFHTFNALHEANRQIVLSSDRPPKEIPTLEERLRSRFEWGLISDIQPPDFETRNAILRKKAQMEGLVIPDDVVHYIAEKIDTNIRELEGALIRLVAYSSLTHQEITLPLAEEALKDILPQTQPRNITVELIQQIVGEHYGLEIKDFKIKKRTRAVAFPRQIAMYLCRELTDYSLPKIGEEFGGRDHTTVIHAYEKIRQDMQKDRSLYQTIESLKRRIKG